jgi:eukaryotic-like serine/threonine-protein kinase
MEDGAKTKGTRPMLELAARSIAQISGVAETMVDVLHGRAFKHYAESIRQYLAARIGDVPTADAALDEVRGMAAARGAEDLTRAPGIRANLFAIARSVAKVRAESLPGTAPERRRALSFRPVRGHDGAYEELLARLRDQLSEEEGEMLELRHARELAPNELALVLGVDEASVDEALDAATLRARAIIGETATMRSGRIEQIILDAWSLDLPVGSQRLDSADERTSLPQGTVIAGRYEIETRVGSGSFADVYRAKDKDVPGHVVAIKLLHQASLSEKAKEAALRELHIIASVFHPSIVQFKDHGWYESRLWFVMPWYEGETLESRITREPLTRKEARTIFEPLARALATMHSVGIRHQDVKPDNIFLAKLPGFGLAGGVLPVLLDLGVAAKEAEMVVAGTPTYFAPEVASQFSQNPRPAVIGPAADVFSLALSLRNSLEPDTQEDVAAGAVETFIEQRANEIPEMPMDKDLHFLEPTLRKWMALDPEDRPTAEELADQLFVLTAPEDRRARFWKLVRWLGPLLLTLGVTFAAVVYVLGQQARLQQLEAEQARLEAARIGEELYAEEERRKALEGEVQEIQESYQQSKLTRRDLANQLGETEGELRYTRESLATERGRTRVLRGEIATRTEENTRLTGELESTTGELTRTQGSLTTERQRTQELTAQLTQTRTELAAAEQNLERGRAHIAELDGQIAAIRGQLAGAQAQSQELERRLAAAEAARARAESDKEAAERRIAQLERDLAEARRAASRPAVPVTPTTPTQPVAPPQESRRARRVLCSCWEGFALPDPPVRRRLRALRAPRLDGPFARFPRSGRASRARALPARASASSSGRGLRGSHRRAPSPRGPDASRRRSEHRPSSGPSRRAAGTRALGAA